MAKFNFVAAAAHIRGVDNHLADALSRAYFLSHYTQAQLCPTRVRRIGPPRLGPSCGVLFSVGSSTELTTHLHFSTTKLFTFLHSLPTCTPTSLRTPIKGCDSPPADCRVWPNSDPSRARLPITPTILRRISSAQGPSQDQVMQHRQFAFLASYERGNLQSHQTMPLTISPWRTSLSMTSLTP